MDYGPSRYGSLLLNGDVLRLEGSLAPERYQGGSISFTVPGHEQRTFTVPAEACLLLSQTLVRLEDDE